MPPPLCSGARVTACGSSDLTVGFGLQVGEYPYDTVTAIFMAALGGHTACVEQLIAAEADPNQAHVTNGFTPLCVAAQSGRHAVVARLLALGVGTDPNQASTDTGATPLLMAAQKGHEAVVARLLAPEVGTDPNQARTDNGATPLLIAVQEGHEAVVALLLAPEVGTDPNQMDITNEITPLWIAAHVGNEAVVKLLLAGGADRTVVTKCGTVAVMAAGQGHATLAELVK